MSGSPEWWLERLAARLERRRGQVALLRSYMDGNAPLPEGADGCREAYQQFQRKARTNWGELVVEAIAERMHVAGFQVGDANSDDDAARKIWKRSRGQVRASDVHRDMLSLGVGYAMVQPGKLGAAITIERPEQCITEQDPLFPDVTVAGLKLFRDSVGAVDWAYLHLPGEVWKFKRPYPGTGFYPESTLGATGGWMLDSGASTGLDFVPIYLFENRDCRGEFAAHIDVIDRINWDVLQRLVITAMQAYRQRATKGDFPDEDADGNEIDYGEMFSPGPGALWRLPENVELWESQPIDLTSILAASKDDIRHLAAVTGTPMSQMLPDNANQSAEGSRATERRNTSKTEDRIGRATPVWDALMGGALAIERGQSEPVEDVETLWRDIERPSLQERADAATKATDLPWRDRMTDIWQFSPDRVDAMEANRASDMFASILQQQPPTVPPANGDPQAPADGKQKQAGAPNDVAAD